MSFETNFEATHDRKKVRYTELAQDVVSAGCNCQNIPFEIGSRGHISLANISTLAVMLSLCKPDERLRTFVLNISKISVFLFHILDKKRTHLDLSRTVESKEVS